MPLSFLKLRSFFFIVLFVMSFALCQSQDRDSLSVTARSGVIVKSQDFNPFYLVHNRLGMVRDHQDFFFQADLMYENKISRNWRFETGFGLRNTLVYQGYGKITWKKWNLYFGRYSRVLGGIEGNDLSTGSFAVSQNATPIPQIGLFIEEFIDVPLTFSYLEFKGGISQGIFEKERHISQALLHRKYVSFRLNFDKEIGFKLSGSLIHIAQYGGKTPFGEVLPSSFSDFFTVFKGAGLPSGVLQGGETNGLGNHFGITEYTAEKRLGDYILTINAQKPFEDSGGMNYTPVKDLLVGVRLDIPRSKLKAVYLEFLQTLWQSGPGIPDRTDEYQTNEDNFGFKFGGRDDFYNNYLYQTGLTYKRRVIGNPLYLTYSWALNFLSVFPNYENQVISNRVRSFHLGANMDLTPEFSAKMLMTITENYGTYAGLYEGRFAWNGIQSDPSFDYVFLDGKNQIYSLLELNYSSSLFSYPVQFKGLFALDSGEFYKNFGMELAICYMLN